MINITTNQIAYNAFLEDSRHNLATEKETSKHNREDERLRNAANIESVRSHVANENIQRNVLVETRRHNYASERNQAEANQLNYSSSIYSADARTTAAKYAADRSYAASTYAANLHAATQRLGIYTSAATSKYAADLNSATQRYSTNMHTLGNVGTSLISTSGGILSTVLQIGSKLTGGNKNVKTKQTQTQQVSQPTGQELLKRIGTGTKQFTPKRS